MATIVGIQLWLNLWSAVDMQAGTSRHHVDVLSDMKVEGFKQRTSKTVLRTDDSDEARKIAENLAALYNVELKSFDCYNRQET